MELRSSMALHVHLAYNWYNIIMRACFHPRWFFVHVKTSDKNAVVPFSKFTLSLDQELISYILHSYILLTKFSSLVPIIIIFVLGFKFKALRRTSSLGLLPDQERNSNQTHKLKQVEADLGEGWEGQGTCAGQGEQQSRKGNVVSATVHSIICMNV